MIEVTVSIGRPHVTTSRSSSNGQQTTAVKLYDHELQVRLKTACTLKDGAVDEEVVEA